MIVIIFNDIIRVVFVFVKICIRTLSVAFFDVSTKNQRPRTKFAKKKKYSNNLDTPKCHTN